uniref:Ribosomal protein S14 n=1 Tax=Melosira undulata TaxID=2133757 RepID=A0A3G1PWH4_9STRA|nr:ribosomal protein S14 [Melosira undulata]AVR57579.1 ribosomal protein S14 [Melosira undulata]
MKYLRKKDNQKRVKFYTFEKFKFLYLTIKKNKNLIKSIQWKIFCTNFVTPKLQIKMYNNRCVYTNRQKSILKIFKMSRLFFLKTIRFGI